MASFHPISDIIPNEEGIYPSAQDVSFTYPTPHHEWSFPPQEPLTPPPPAMTTYPELKNGITNCLGEMNQLIELYKETLRSSMDLLDEVNRMKETSDLIIRNLTKIEIEIKILHRRMQNLQK